MPGRRRGGPGPSRGRAGPGPGRGRTRRRVRRTRRRRVVIGGALVFAAGGAAYKLTKGDADKIEAASGKPVEDMTEEELNAQIQSLGIEEQEVTDSDMAALESDGEGEASAAAPVSTSAAAPASAPAESTDTSQLEQLAQLHDQGILTDEEFEAKKKLILGL